MKVLLGITIISLLFSCSDLNKSDQLASISDLNNQLDSIEQVWEDNKIDTLAQWELSVYDVENRIKKYYVSDTIDMEFGRKMDAFKVLRRQFKPLGKAINALRTGIAEERESLEKLKTDIEEGNGERGKYDEFIAFEKEKVNQLVTLSTDFVETKQKCLDTYEELYPELNAFSWSLVKEK